MNRFSKITLAAAILSTAAAGAYAAKSHLDKQTAMANVTVTLTQAITIAEQHANGRATGADLERSKTNGLVYEVDVLSNGNRIEVDVDAMTGTLVASKVKGIDDESDDDDHDGDDHDHHRHGDAGANKAHSADNKANAVQ